MTRPTPSKWRILRTSAILSIVGALGVASTTVLASPSRDAMRSSGINPANFVKGIDNPYLPMKPGTIYVYVGQQDEQVLRNVVNITHHT